MKFREWCRNAFEIVARSDKKFETMRKDYEIIAKFMKILLQYIAYVS